MLICSAHRVSLRPQDEGSNVTLGFDKEVRLQTHDKDKYRHTLADVLLLDGSNVNPYLGKDGWCW